MFAIAFDLVVADAQTYRPKSITQAYTDIEKSLLGFGFNRAQGSVYLSENEDLASLLFAMNSLKSLPWFPKVVRDIRAFRVEQWSDFIAFMQQE